MSKTRQDDSVMPKDRWLKMRLSRICLLAFFLLLFISACSGGEDLDDSGYVVMMPFVSEEMGFRSIVPANWATEDGAEYMRREIQMDQTTLIQVSLPGTSMTEAKAYAAIQLGLEALPASLGTYTSPRLTWDLYEFYPPLSELVEIKMQLAMSEVDGDVYAVVMAALTGDYEAEAPYHETIFKSVLYSLSPLE